MFVLNGLGQRVWSEQAYLIGLMEEELRAREHPVVRVSEFERMAVFASAARDAINNFGEAMAEVVNRIVAVLREGGG